MSENKISRTIQTGIISLIAVIALLVCATFASYSNTSSGASAVPVANFGIEMEGLSGQSLVLDGSDPEAEVSYKVTVSNEDANAQAEVDLNYDMELVLPEALPEGVGVKFVTNTAITQPSSVSADGKTYKFSNSAWYLKQGSKQSQEHNLTFYIKEDETVSDPAELSNIRVSAVGIQVD